ncbi:hypothetical protein M5X00_00960 [Paenibacillus alvei]|uniref:hypothetical protein n=1 Tax=Paenibacillus alvei TaxID=44250 RepID=UPI00227FBF2A|nr:hypothetical protein [Paenibacillus alvei]MCY9703087.1 hypothetical protein [Paenibacillus alvei]MCY9752828.1 hypothetical protein [Paenibacillus alvei]
MQRIGHSTQISIEYEIVIACRRQLGQQYSTAIEAVRTSHCSAKEMKNRRETADGRSNAKVKHDKAS